MPSDIADEITPFLQLSHSQSHPKPHCTNGIIPPSDDVTEKPARGRTKQQTFTLVFLALSNVCAMICFSLIAPFFPKEAEAKGVSSTVVGLIFSCYEFIVFISAPIFGHYMTTIGPRFMFVSGTLVSGCCSILFGTLDKSPNGTIFVVMCFLCRIVEALGISAYLTASYAIVAHTFPDNVATVFGVLETFIGIGMMLGPPIGGALYEAGGYGLPFFVLGSILILCGFATCGFLPNPDDKPLTYKGSILTLLSSPLALLTCGSIFTATGTLGFIDATISRHLDKEFNLSALWVGLVFMIESILYAISAPLLGWVGDKKGQIKSVVLCGHVLGSVCFILLGPSSLFPFIPSELWINILALTAYGVVQGCLLIPTFRLLLLVAGQKGMPDNFDTNGLVSGLFNSCYSLGAFTGPTVGGIIVDNLGFSWASTACSGVFVVMTIITILYLLCQRRCSPSYTGVDEERSLLVDSGDVVAKKYYATRTLDHRKVEDYKQRSIESSFISSYEIS